MQSSNSMHVTILSFACSNKALSTTRKVIKKREQIAKKEKKFLLYYKYSIFYLLMLKHLVFINIKPTFLLIFFSSNLSAGLFGNKHFQSVAYVKNDV